MTKDTISFQEAKRIVVDIRDTYRMVDVLSNDLDRIVESLDSVKVQGELQFWLRVAVRSAIDSLDAHNYRLKLLTKTAIKVKELEPLPKPDKKKKKSLANFFNELAYALESTYRMIDRAVDFESKSLGFYFLRVRYPNYLPSSSGSGFSFIQRLYPSEKSKL